MKHDLREVKRYEGLFQCACCGAAEGELPTECPGKRMTGQQKADVFGGLADFRDGVWVYGPAVV